MASATLLLGTPQVAGPSEVLVKSQGAPGRVSMFLQLHVGCVLQAAKELMFYSLASFSWLILMVCLPNHSVLNDSCQLFV